MKAMLIIIISLLIFIPTAIWVQSSLEKQSHEMAQAIQEIDKAIKIENWQSASTKMKDLQKSWNPKRYFWKMATYHMEIDKIDQSFARIGVLIDLKEKNESLAELAVLKQALLHIPEREKLSITNIF